MMHMSDFNIENTLRELMTKRCMSMHNPSMRCYGKECNGQCAQFQVALNQLTELYENFPKICNEQFSEYTKKD